jgi:hypothetical protein
VRVLFRGWFDSLLLLLLRRAATVVAARISCAVQPFLWYCLDEGRSFLLFFGGPHDLT